MRKSKSSPEESSESPVKPLSANKRRFSKWWNSLSAAEKAAYIGGVFILLAALIGLAGEIVVSPIVAAWLNRPTATRTPPPTPTPTYTPTPTKTSTPSPSPTSYAIIQAFSIIKDGKVIDVVKRDGTTKLNAGWQVQVRAELLSHPNKMDLLFVWFTCWTGNAIHTWGRSIFQIDYRVPTTVNEDCIRVEIKPDKGGGLKEDALDNRAFKVEVQK